MVPCWGGACGSSTGSGRSRSSGAFKSGMEVSGCWLSASCGAAHNQWLSRWVLAVQGLGMAGQQQNKWMSKSCKVFCTSILNGAGQRLWLILWLRGGLWACTLDRDTCSPGRRLHRPARWPRRGCGALGQALWSCKILCWPAPSQFLINNHLWSRSQSADDCRKLRPVISGLPQSTAISWQPVRSQGLLQHTACTWLLEAALSLEECVP